MQSITVGLCLLQFLLTSAAYAQVTPPAPEPPPDYSIKVTGYFDSETLADFGERVKGYVELRTRLDGAVPTLRVTLDADEIEAAEEALAKRIRAARASARHGDIFAQPFQAQLGRMLVVEVDEKTLAVIMGDNPGEFSFKLNGTYPRHKAIATMPANLLQLLPALEDGVEFRFIGRHLILRDTKANIIIDDIPFALTCTDCKRWTVEPRDQDRQR